MKCCLIPAAGAASRMRGRDKLLEPVDGAPVLRVLTKRALQAGAEQVIITLPHLDHPRAQALADLRGLQLIEVPDADLGLSQSLKAGIAACPEQAEALMILPADMPAVTACDMRQLWQVFDKKKPAVLRAATAEGLPGHPVIFQRAALSLFDGLTGDQGAKAVLRACAEDVMLHPLDDGRARLDLDTPEDWADWRAALKASPPA